MLVVEIIKFYKKYNSYLLISLLTVKNITE